MQCETIVVYVTPSLRGPEEWCYYMYIYICIYILVVHQLKIK